VGHWIGSWTKVPGDSGCMVHPGVVNWDRQGSQR
jgi:hypothetical protein